MNFWLRFCILLCFKCTCKHSHLVSNTDNHTCVGYILPSDAHPGVSIRIVATHKTRLIWRIPWVLLLRERAAENGAVERGQVFLQRLSLVHSPPGVD